MLPGQARRRHDGIHPIRKCSRDSGRGRRAGPRYGSLDDTTAQFWASTGVFATFRMKPVLAEARVPVDCVLLGKEEEAMQS